MARDFLHKSIKKAISHRQDFCYETNFNSTPMFWPKIFKEANYNLDMIFFCLDTIEKAKKRVTIRVENGGHYVPNAEIEKRFHQGYKNLDLHFNLHLLDSNFYKKSPEHILSFSNGKITKLSIFPEFLTKLTPLISKIFQS